MVGSFAAKHRDRSTMEAPPGLTPRAVSLPQRKSKKAATYRLCYIDLAGPVRVGNESSGIRHARPSRRVSGFVIRVPGMWFDSTSFLGQG